MKTFEQYIEGYFSDQKSDYSDPPSDDIQKVDIDKRFAGIEKVKLPVTNRKFIKSEVRRKFEKNAKTHGKPIGSVEPSSEEKDLVGEVDYEGKKISVRWNPVYKKWEGSI